LNGQNTSARVLWISIDVVEGGRRLSAADDAMIDLVAAEDEQRIVRYTNQAGEPFEN
jgi:hypothetical protein